MGASSEIAGGAVTVAAERGAFRCKWGALITFT